MRRAELEAIVAKLVEEQRRTEEERRKTEEERRKTEEIMREERRKTEEVMREERRKTDEVMREERRKTEEVMREERRKTEEAERKMNASIDRLSEEHRKTEESMREERHKTDESMRLERRKTEEVQRKTEKSIHEMSKSVKSLSEEHRKTEEVIRQTKKELGGIGNTQGAIAEESFFRAISDLCATSPYNMHFDSIQRRSQSLQNGMHTEFDIMAVNEEAVLVVEVKTKLLKEDVEHFRDKLVHFRTYFPIFKDHIVIGAVAGLVVHTDVEQIAEKLGLFVFTQTSKDGASIANRVGFTPRKY